MRTLMAILMAATVGLVLACGENGQVEQRKEEYVSKIKEKLLEVEGRMAELRQRADDLLTEERARFQAQIDTLAKYQDAAERKLKDLQAAEGQRWQEMRARLDSLIAKLDSTFEQTRSW